MNKPTVEMVDFFKKRTREHIDRVNSNLQNLSMSYPEVKDIRGLHDGSKFKEPELTPYIWLTECYRCKRLNLPFQYPKGMEERITEATNYHIRTNKHHPEFWTNDQIEIDTGNRDKLRNSVNCKRMPNKYLIEMVCDWAAMSKELKQGINGTKTWADNNIGSRWSFTEAQIKFIYKIIKELREINK